MSNFTPVRVMLPSKEIVIAKEKEMFDKLIAEGAKELKELPKGKQFEGIF